MISNEKVVNYKVVLLLEIYNFILVIFSFEIVLKN
jgi:hypothetical protein